MWTACTLKINKQNENSICTLRAAVSQPNLLLLPLSFVTERLRDKLRLCSCLVLHKSHRGKFMVDRCSRKRGLFPLCHRVLARGRGFMVTDSDPELTSPCVATETDELRKKGRKPGGGELRADGVREERSGVCIFMYNCLCLAVFLPGTGTSDHTQHTTHKTHTHTVVCSCTLAWSQHYLLLLIWQCAVSSTTHKDIFLQTQLASSKMAGW